MENLIEKLKTVDKKVWIGVGIGAAVLIIVIVALVIGGKKPAGGNTQGTQAGTETEISTEVFGTEDVTEVLGTETTETEMTTETEVVEEGQSTAGIGGTTVTQPEAVDGVEQNAVTTKPDGSQILGAGSASDPYKEIPNLENMTLETIAIPAGQTVYYDIQRIGGMWFEINDPDLYVIDSAGNRHDSGFTVQNAMANEYVSFQIGNKSGAAKSFTLKFSNVRGSWDNPEVISGNGPFSKHLNAGDEVGHWFRINVSQTGTVKIYLTYASVDTELNIQSVDTSDITTARTYTADVQTDAKGNYVEVPVTAGGRLLIHVQAIKPTRGSIPATDITFELVYQ